MGTETSQMESLNCAALWTWFERGLFPPVAQCARSESPREVSSAASAKCSTSGTAPLRDGALRACSSDGAWFLASQGGCRSAFPARVAVTLETSISKQRS